MKLNRFSARNYFVRKLVGKTLIFISCVTIIFTVLITTDFQFFRPKPGDTDGDNLISRADVETILSTAACVPQFSNSYIRKASDINGDGIINAIDAKIAFGRMSGNVTYLDEPETEVTTAPLVSGSSIVTSDTQTGEVKPVTNDADGVYNVISSDKMYIYPDFTQAMALRNTFVIVTFGWGHGVGMSQHGAVGLARSGYSYIQIIQHYYKGVTVMKENYPATVTCAGRSVNTVEMLARIIQIEIAGITKKNDALDINALRAQAVAAYTNMKFSGYSVSGCSYVSSYDSCRDDVKQVAREIAGQFIQYGGNVVYAYYSACSAGISATYSEVWGDTSKDMGYLPNVASYYDCYTPDYITATTYTPEQMKKYLLSYDSSIVLTNNPDDWIQILEHDDAVNEKIGYVTKMQLGDKVISSAAGNRFKESVMDYDIKSPCFTIIYNGQYQ